MSKEQFSFHEVARPYPEYFARLSTFCEEQTDVTQQEFLLLGMYLGQFFDHHAVEVESPLPPHHFAHRYCEVEQGGVVLRLQSTEESVHITRRADDQGVAHAGLSAPMYPDESHPHEAVFQSFVKLPDTNELQVARFRGDEAEKAHEFYLPLARQLIRPFLQEAVSESPTSSRNDMPNVLVF